MDDVELDERLARARAGDERALGELLAQYEGEVRVVVRHRLPRALRSQYDSMDFVQAVWQSVYTGGRLDLGRFDNPRHLLRYLSAVACNKVNEAYRHRRTLKHDIQREEPLYVVRGNSEVPRDLPGNGPTPSQDAQADDRLAQILRGRGPLERQIVDLRRSGLTFQEVADRLGIHESKVRSIVESLRRRVKDLPCR